VVYQAIAPIYDRIMAHVRYDEWAALINKVIRKYSAVPRPSIFELGAGTGRLAAELIGQGLDYTGSDASFSMCLEARRRTGRFVCADARNLPVRRRFDLVLFLYDGINYLMSVAEYRRVFEEVHALLRDGGLFLFDITTQENSRRHFNEFIDFEDFDAYYYIRRSWFNEADRTQHNEFTVFKRVREDPPLFDKRREHHVQTVMPAETLRDAVPARLFEVVGMWDGFSFSRCHRRSERVHFLLRRKPGLAGGL